MKKFEHIIKGEAFYKEIVYKLFTNPKLGTKEEETIGD
jgi:hypothetical protein